MPNVPGVTINRYCSSSLMSIRMAAHAIKAGEGDVFIAAGVETVSRFINGMADSGPHNPLYAAAEARTAERTGRRPGRVDPAGSACPTSTSPWVRPPRTWPTSRRSSREEQDEFAALSQQRATASLENGFWENEITPVTTKDDEGNEVVVTKDDGIRAGTTAEGLSRPQAGVPPRGHRHRRQRLPAQRRRRRRRWS
jgi:acetyl-CoA C-acetyltransferase